MALLMDVGLSSLASWAVMVLVLALLVGLALSAFGIGPRYDLFFRTNDPLFGRKTLIGLAVAVPMLFVIMAATSNIITIAPPLWVGTLVLIVLLWEPVFLCMGICALAGKLLPHSGWKEGMLLGVPFGFIAVYLLRSTPLLISLNDLRPGIADHWMLPLYPIPGTVLVAAAPVSILALWSVWKRTSWGTSFDFFEYWDRAEGAYLELKSKLKRRRL